MKKTLVFIGIILTSSISYGIPLNSEIGQDLYQFASENCIQNLSTVPGLMVGQTIEYCECFSSIFTKSVTMREIEGNSEALTKSIEKKIEKAENSCAKHLK